MQDYIDAKVIGQRLRDLRGDRTTQDIADELGITASAVGMYERGERVPIDSLKVKLANLYGTTVQDIFFAT